MENSKRGTIPMQEKLKFSKSQGDTKRELKVSCYTDAGYLTDVDDIKSQTGYAVWICKFISGLGVVPTLKEPINMYCDNTGAIAIAKDHGVIKGARHFCAKVHYLRETIEMGDVKIEKVDTDDNLADPFTKALAFPKHSELTEKIGMIPASTDIAKITRKRSKPDKHGHGNGIDCAKAGRMLSWSTVHGSIIQASKDNMAELYVTKASHWWKPQEE
ncbi:hypothetical protein Tco_1461276 [Tanacetum coccineum]